MRLFFPRVTLPVHLLDMANFIVVSPGQTTSGGDSGDLFVFRSGAVSGSTVIGGAGADTLQLIEGGSARGVSLQTNGGADVFQFSAVDLSGANVLGGAGGDTINLSGAGTLGTIGLGAGSDNLVFKGATDLGGNSVKVGGGADLFTGSEDVSASGASLLMGAGQDTVTITASEFGSGKLVGGGGADKINLNIKAGTQYTVQGGAGGDTIVITAALDSGSLLLGNGSDKVTLVGDMSKTSEILASKGADLINLSAATMTDSTGLTIGGGAGKDTIEIATAGAGAIVFGGGGNDSIHLDAVDYGLSTAGAATYSAGASLYTTIQGGVGADSIVFSGSVAASAGYEGVISFSAYAESTEASQDLISFDKSAGNSVGFLIDFGGTIATGIAASNKIGDLGTNANGFLNSAGNNSSVSERISAMNTLLVTGQIGVFKDSSGSAAYLFVQGGSTDLVAKFDPSNAVSAGAAALSATGGDGSFKLTFGEGQ